MLTITRRAGQSICIGDDIRVTVLHMQGGQIRLGIDAPDDVIIDRDEIRELRNAENKLLRQLHVYGARFSRPDGSRVYTSVAAKSEGVARMLLHTEHDIVGDIDLITLLTPNMLDRERDGTLSIVGARTLSALRTTLRAGYFTPCTLMDTTIITTDTEEDAA